MAMLAELRDRQAFSYSVPRSSPFCQIEVGSSKANGNPAVTQMMVLRPGVVLRALANWVIAERVWRMTVLWSTQGASNGSAQSFKFVEALSLSRARLSALVSAVKGWSCRRPVLVREKRPMGTPP